MPVLRNLPGTTGDRDVEVVHSSAAAIRHLRANGAATMAGDNGAINVWIDDDGNYRCERYKFQITQSSEVYGTFGKVESWLREHRPRIQ